MNDYCGGDKAKDLGQLLSSGNRDKTVKTALETEGRQPGNEPHMKLGNTSLPRLRSAEDTAGGALPV